MDSVSKLSTHSQTEKESKSAVLRTISALAILLYTYEYAQMVLLNNLYEVLAVSFNLDKLAMGYLSMSYYLGMLIMYPTVGWSVNRYSPTSVLGVSLLGVTLGTLVFACSNSYEWLLISRFVQGIFAAFTYVSCLLVATSSYPTQLQAIITGYVFAAGACGGSLSQVLGQVAIAAMGWRNAIYANVLLGIIIIVPYLVCCMTLPATTTNTNNNSIFWLMKKAFEDKRVWYCAGVAASLNIALVAMGAIYGSSYLQHVHHMDPDQAAKICGLLYFGVIIGAILWGKLSWFMKSEMYSVVFGTMGAILTLLSLSATTQTNMDELSWYFIIIGVFCSAQAQVYPYIAKILPSTLIGAAKASIVMIVIGAATMLPWVLTHTHSLLQTFYATNALELTSIIIPELIIINLLGGMCALKLKRSNISSDYTSQSIA